MRAIDADTLYEKLKEDEDLARQRVIDTPNSFPNGSLNPSAIRYMAQLSERTRFKEMIYDAPTIEPERKKGKWIEISNTNHTYICSECGRMLVNISDGKNMVAKNYPFCHCGAYMKEGEKE